MELSLNMSLVFVVIGVTVLGYAVYVINKFDRQYYPKNK